MAKLPICLLALLTAAPLSGQAVRSDTEGVQAGLRFDMTRFVIDSAGTQTWRPGVGAEAALGITSRLAAFVSYSHALFDGPEEYSVTHADLGARFNMPIASGLLIPHVDAAIAWRGVDLHDDDPSVPGMHGFGTTVAAGFMVHASPRMAAGVRAQQTRMRDFMRPAEYRGGELVQVGHFDDTSTRVSVLLRYTSGTNIGGGGPVEVGGTVRVWDAASVQRATVLGFSRDSVRLAIGSDEQVRALSDIRRLERAEHALPLHAAAVGLMAGGIASALFTSGRDGSFDEPIWIAGGAVAGGLLGVLSAPAQRWRTGTLPLPAALTAAASRNAAVRLHAPAYPAVAGDLIRAASDSLVLRTRHGEIAYPVATLRQIELRQTQSAASLGGLIGAAAGAGIVALTDPDRRGLSFVQAFFFGAAIGGAAGSAIGTQYQLERWTTVYRR